MFLHIQKLFNEFVKFTLNKYKQMESSYTEEGKMQPLNIHVISSFDEGQQLQLNYKQMMENSINANAGQFGYNALGTEQYQFYAYAPQNNYTIGDDQDLNIVWYKEEAFSQNFKAELVEPFTVTKKEFANSTNQYDHNQFTLTGSVKIETASK